MMVCIHDFNLKLETPFEDKVNIVDHAFFHADAKADQGMSIFKKNQRIDS